MFNNKLNATSMDLVAKYPELKLVVFDIYHPLLAIIRKPGDHGNFCYYLIITCDMLFTSLPRVSGRLKHITGLF